MEPGIEMWTIYDHPADYPDHYVARKFINETPTKHILKNENLYSLYESLPVHLDVFFERDARDGPTILGVWL